MLRKFSVVLLATIAVALAQKPSSPSGTSRPKPPPEQVRAIAKPTHPHPPEEESAGISKFSFIIYGDTRGRRDGKEIQYEHSLVMDSMLSTIAARAKTEFPVRFVLQSGDAVVDGRDPKQWNASFLSIINRLTTVGGVPYFLAPGNHDVTSASELTSTNRLKGLTNYLAAISQLIPPEGASRRLEDYPTFAFGYGNSFFIALDSNIAGDKYDWTVQQLESIDRHRYTNVFAFFHHPLFSSGPHGGASIEKPTEQLRKIYSPLFRKYHFRGVFSGHEHLFEHWAEHYVDSAGVTNRLDYLVTGGGGAPLYGLKGNPNTGDYEKAFEKEKVKLTQLARPGPDPGDNPYHYVLVTVNGPTVNLEVVGVDWGRDYRPYRSNKIEFTDSH